MQKALANNDLRDDLYYRLAVVELFLPPLRERIGDIKLLANEFLARFAQQNGRAITGFANAAWDWILSYTWPGNVRELKNAVERAVIMSRSDTITLADVMPRHLHRAAGDAAMITLDAGATLADSRRQLVLRAIASTNGDYARAATIVGMTPAEVRAELASLVRSNGSREGSPSDTVSRHPRPEAAVAASARKGSAGTPSAKSKPKKR